MTMHHLEYSEFTSIERKTLAARLDAIRAVVKHAGEKGRALEHEVSSLLRDFLPNEYGISTGFIAYHTDNGPELSSQLDIIIYDALRGNPLANLGTCEVIPIEFVYAYIEVKATLTSTSDDAKEYADNSIEKCVLKSKELRSLRKRKFWVPMPGSYTKIGLIEEDWLSIHPYIFAYSATGTIAQAPTAMARRMSNFMKKTGHPAHLYGIFICDGPYYETIPVDLCGASPDDYFHVRYTTDENTLGCFKTSLLSALSRFTRFPENWVPALEQYFSSKPVWEEVSPEVSKDNKNHNNPSC